MFQHPPSPWPRVFFPSLAVLALATVASAQDTLPAGAPEAAPQWDTGSIAWMLTSSALVLLMIPGLALFYAGMVRAKNTLNMLMCCFAAIGVIGLHWVVIGYCLAFSGTPLITIGDWNLLGWDPSLLFLRAFGEDYARPLMSGDLENALPTGIPELVFVMFQGKFAIITPALIVGALAERVRFGPFLLFMLIWSTIVYCPVAFWVWNVQGPLWNYGVLDFAGGTVVHVLAGVSALALCLVIGPRRGLSQVHMPPHSLGLTLIGAGLLWFGWFGFNAGSAVALPGAELPVSGPVAGLAFANTQIAAAAAATAWMLIEWLVVKRPTALGFASGMVAGLVVITPCAGHVAPASSILIGAAAGVVCFYGCRLKNLLKYDDSLDAFGVHGIGGALGALLVGIFAMRPVAGGFEQFVKQLVGLGVTAVFAFVLTFVIGLIIHKTIGLRVSEDVEADGLDIGVHGEVAYHLS